jgi:tetratricopeptide (TPR) repeat protein
MLAMEKDLLQEAERYFVIAVQHGLELGLLFGKYGLEPSMQLAITEEFVAVMSPSERSALLALAGIYHRQKRLQESAQVLQRLYDRDPSDAVVRLTIAEIYMETQPDDETACQKVLQLAEGIENDSPVHAVLLLYKAKALRGLKMPTAAIDILSKAIRKTSSRSDDLLRAIRYQRALAYQDSGKNARYRDDLEKLYAESPDYSDVAKRLGLSTDVQPSENRE